MTSSLVGSEMCIRDSPRSMRRVWIITILTGPACVLVEMIAGWPSWKAVSYTHLTLPTICSV
eukprot:939334-Prorocentrum_lima.AAC.1